MNKNKILIVEDEYIVAMDIRQILENKLGYEVLGMIRSGEEAIEAAKNRNPDLILMDIILDGKLTGIEAAARIKQRFNIPVIYLTAFSDKDTLANAKLTEPYGYLLKPLDEHALHSAIEMALYKAKAERTIIENEERYRMLVENSPVAIGVHCEGKIVYMNPAGIRLFGAVSAKELIGRSMMDFIHHDQKKFESGSAGKFRTKGMTVEGIPEKLVRFDGKIIDVETAAIPTYFEEKPAIEVIFRDITELKRKDRIQKSVLGLLQVLNLNTSSEDFFVLFANTIKEYIPVSSVIVGVYNLNTGIIKYLLNECDNNDKLIEGLIEYTVKQNSTVRLDTRSLQEILNTGPGTPVTNWIGLPLVYDEDNIGIIAGINSDPGSFFGAPEQELFELFSFSVSKALMNLIKLEEQDKVFLYLENLNSVKDKFFSSLSHELKNNFNSLLGYTEILKNSFDTLSSSDIHSSVESLFASSRTIYNLIEKLLRFSRYSSQSYKPKLKIIPLAEILDRELAAIEIFAEKKNILFKKCIEESVEIYAEEEILITILQDFLIQSIRYSDAGSRLEVNALDTGTHIEISVTDKGIGIEQYLLKNLFIIKNSSNQEELQDEKGIGFLLTREIIRKCGGELIIENSQGEGSTFKILVPASKKQKVIV